MTPKTIRWSLIGIAVVGVILVALVVIGTWPDSSLPSDRTLSEALTDVNRIRVRSGGTCHRTLDSERTLVEEKDPSRIQAIIRSIHVVNTRSKFYCGCCGDPSIEFYRGDELVVTLGYHHGSLVRWHEGWKSDGQLTDDSAAWLNAWLASHGVNPKQGTTHQDKNKPEADRKMGTGKTGMGSSPK